MQNLKIITNDHATLCIPPIYFIFTDKILMKYLIKEKENK